METADSTTGNGDEQSGEDGGREPFTVNAVVQFGQRGPLDEQHRHQRYCHEEHRDGKEWIDLADDLVDGQHRGNDIINEDDAAPDINPREPLATQFAEDECRTVHKHRTHHHQQEHGEHQHHLLCGLSQVVANQLGLTGTTVTNGEHAAKIIVNSTGKDTSKDNPQIGRRTELGSHDSTEDGARSCDVQELNHENLPGRQHDVINTIGLSYGRRRSVVGAKHLLYETTIEKVAQNKSQKTQNKRYHIVFLNIFCKGIK